MSSIQSPQILTDLYRDLRDRRLLPLVLVLLVGMAIVPIALSSSGETPAPSAPPPPALASASNAPAEEVVALDPGVRDYRRRLEDDAPKDPFIQGFASPLAPDAGAALDISSASPVGGTTTAETVPAAPAAPTAPTAPTGGSPTQPQTQSRYFFYRVKVRSGQLGTELKVRDSVGSLTPLPSENVPALAFLGVNTGNDLKAKSAVFLVSTSVSSVDGEGSCSFAGSQCQLLSLKPGEYADLVWSDGLVYRVKLVKFDLVTRTDPPSVGGDGNSGSAGREGSSGRHFSF